MLFNGVGIQLYNLSYILLYGGLHQEFSVSGGLKTESVDSTHCFSFGFISD